jgi:hypothetical protein
MKQPLNIHEIAHSSRHHAAMQSDLLARADLSLAQQAFARILGGGTGSVSVMGEGACFVVWKVSGLAGMVLKVAKDSWHDDVRARYWLEACSRLVQVAQRDDLPLVPGLLPLQTQAEGRTRVGLLMTEGVHGPQSRDMSVAHPDWQRLQDGLTRHGLILGDHPQFLQTQAGVVFVSDWSDLTWSR